MWILYLDDSGKIHKNDTSTTVATFAGFSVEKSNWHRVNRQLNGAKANIFPNRAGGNPNAWEVKSNDFLNVRDWQRSKNRKFCNAVADILKRNQCTVYSISLDKTKARDTLDPDKFVPLMLQRLATVFYDQTKSCQSWGTIVLDWSTHQLDHHISNCITSMSIANGMETLIGGVTYGSSSALTALQAADIIASTFRREAEGQSHINSLADEFRKIEYASISRDSVGYAIPIRSIDRVY